MEGRGARNALREGHTVCIFAEGSITRTGELLPFKKGAFYMAVLAGVPIVPVAIKNTDMLMGKGTGQAKSGVIEMSLLPPVDTTAPLYKEDLNALVQTVHRAVARELKISANDESYFAASDGKS